MHSIFTQYATVALVRARETTQMLVFVEGYYKYIRILYNILGSRPYIPETLPRDNRAYIYSSHGFTTLHMTDARSPA